MAPLGMNCFAVTPKTAPAAMLKRDNCEVGLVAKNRSTFFDIDSFEAILVLA